MKWLNDYFKSTLEVQKITNGEFTSEVNSFIIHASKVAEEVGAIDVTLLDNTCYFSNCTIEIVYSEDSVYFRKIEKDIEVDYVKFVKTNNKFHAYAEDGAKLRELDSHKEAVEYGFEYLLTLSTKVHHVY
jgi:hypothetical protein